MRYDRTYFTFAQSASTKILNGPISDLFLIARNRYGNFSRGSVLRNAGRRVPFAFPQNYALLSVECSCKKREVNSSRWERRAAFYRAH